MWLQEGSGDSEGDAAGVGEGPFAYCNFLSSVI
jgi:hypothetical protein